MMPRPSVEASVHLRVESVERFSGNVHRVRDELDAVASSDNARVLIACQTDAECHRLTDVLAAGQVGAIAPLATGDRPRARRLPPRRCRRSWCSAATNCSTRTCCRRERSRAAAPPAGKIESRAIDTFLDLNEGDYVVHVNHGIARFRGMRMLEKGVGIQESGFSEEVDDLNPESRVLQSCPGREPDPRVPRRRPPLRSGIADRPGAEVRRRRQDRAGAVEARRHRLGRNARTRVERSGRRPGQPR